MAASQISSMTPIAPDFSGTGVPTAYTGATSPNFSTNPATGPLSSLYATTGFTPYYYPNDLASSTKNHYVKFWIKEIIGSGYRDASGSSIELFGFPDLQLTPQTTKSIAVISLYMPDTMTATYNASYDELSLMNDLGAVKGLQTISALADAIKDKIKGNYNSTDSSAVEYLKSLGTQVLSGSAATADVYLAGGGITINPQLQMIYRGVGFREFQLTFNFTPTSSQESEEVNAIIGEFKYHFAPELASAPNGAQSMFMTPPSIFDIEFMFGAAENLYLPKYGNCVLTNIDVNYAPNGFAAYNNGAPVQTQLNLTFKEIEIVTKKKLQAGYTNSSIAKGALR